MATLGITRRSRSTFTRRVASPPSVRTTTRPATERGRSQPGAGDHAAVRLHGKSLEPAGGRCFCLLADLERGRIPVGRRGHKAHRLLPGQPERGQGGVAAQHEIPSGQASDPRIHAPTAAYSPALSAAWQDCPQRDSRLGWYSESPAASRESVPFIKGTSGFEMMVVLYHLSC